MEINLKNFSQKKSTVFPQFFHSPYFLQTKIWSDFWLKANPKNHLTYHLKKQVKNSNLSLNCVVYQYPYYFGHKFLYIPKGPFFCYQKHSSTNSHSFYNLNKVKKGVKEDSETLTKLLFEEIYQICIQQEILFLKIDFDDNFANIFNLNTLNTKTITKFLKQAFNQPTLNLNFKTKSLQYLKTPVLDLNQVVELATSNPKLEFSLNQMVEFMAFTKSFWLTTNQNVRRYTRKSLQKNWKISLQKTQDNFENLWSLLNSTAKRQGFKLHTKQYIQKLFEANFSRVIVLKDSKNQAQSAFLGVFDTHSFTYIFGGNSDISLKNYGQYLEHLIAVYLIFTENQRRLAKDKTLVGYYDLGGYDSSKGYGQFKLNYKGSLREFTGPVDIALKPFNYFSINLIRLVFKKFNNFKTRVLKTVGVS